jgi:regulator of replication initiation timing
MDGGKMALEQKMRNKPLPCNRIPLEQENMIIDVALKYPKFGRAKISQIISESYNLTINSSTVQSVLSRNDLSTVEQRKQARKSADKFMARQAHVGNDIDACDERKAVEEFIANPKITRSQLCDLLSEQSGLRVEPKKLSEIIRKNLAEISFKKQEAEAKKEVVEQQFPPDNEEIFKNTLKTEVIKAAIFFPTMNTKQLSECMYHYFQHKLLTTSIRQILNEAGLSTTKKRMERRKLDESHQKSAQVRHKS